MRMSEVKVGMRLRSTMGNDIGGDITVTEITEHGFKYSYDAPVSIHPRRGVIWAKDGHQHFGVDGEAFYEVVDV